MPAPLSRIAIGLCLAVALGGCTSPTASTTTAEPLATGSAELRGTTLDGLRSAGWDCQQRGPSFISCAPPGMGLPPIPPLGENGRPVYELAVFLLDGTPFGTAHFLRADLYHGQTCAFTGEPFVFRAIVGYFECLRTD